MTASPNLSALPRRLFVILIGGSAQQRASICHAASNDKVHIEPVAAPGGLNLRDLTAADVLLAWDHGETIGDLKAQLAIIGIWSPIVAIAERPSTARVV